MNRIPVSSSNLASVGYDLDTQSLEIEFLHGGIYRYSCVPSSVYDGLMEADSHGFYFDRYVKKAGYHYQKVSTAVPMVEGDILREPHKQISLSIDLNDNVSTEAVVLEIVELCKAINAYHISCGGTGLDIDDWDLLVQLRQLAGV
jgi:hypothetical protein